MKKQFILPLITFVAVLTACTRVERGVPGPPGRDGLNANVWAYIFEVLPSAWNQAGIPGDPDFGFFALAGFPDLTDNVLSNGAVSGYYILNDGGQLPMPAIFYNNGYQTNYDYVLYRGEIEFWVRESDNQTFAPATNQYYKIVIVTGNFKTLPDLQSMTLEEVEAYFNITEYQKVRVE